MAHYKHGLKQGTPLSCLMANLVILMKHGVRVLKEVDVGHGATQSLVGVDGYQFDTWDMEWDGNEASRVVAH